MIRRVLMVSIRLYYDSVSGSIKDTSSIQCVGGQEPWIHEMWILGLDNITREVHSTSQVEVPSGTIRWFVTDYLAENGCRVQIIRKISINDSVQFLGVPALAWGSGFPFICNMQALAKAIGWGSCNYSNQYWGGSMFDAKIIKNVAWGESFDVSPANSPRSPVNPHAAARRVCNNILCLRSQERL